MDNTTYPTSDTDVNEAYENCDFNSMASNELDFVDHWVNLTVEKEVLRGSKLREEKFKTYPMQDECQVANVNLTPCIEMNTSYYSSSRPLPGRAKVKSATCSLRSQSPFLGQKSSSRAYTPQTVYSRPTTPNVKDKCLRRCPMRIAELAVPTKRQCIDTWRSKCDVLPAFMVERLRQQVMDQRPIVQIHEAISCFKRREPRSVKSFKRSTNISRVSSKVKNDRMMEIRNLCVIFANKIAQRLIIPQNSKLTPEFKKISKIVADELTNIVHNRKKYDMDAITNKMIQTEIADKITIWIAMILEDTSYKMLEDDLRVKRNFEHEEVKEEHLVTLIGKLEYGEKGSELEEEEGPVLDFIDDLVDNVVTICEPKQEEIQENDVSEATSKASREQDDRSVVSPDTTENNKFDTSTLYTNITYDTGDGAMNKSHEIDATASAGSRTRINFIQEIDDQLFNQTDVADTENINDHIQGEIQKIIDSFIPADNYETEDNEKADLIDLHQDLIPPQKDMALVEDVVLSSKNSFEDSMDNLMHLDEDDDKNKKVKFSEIEMDAKEPNRQLNSNSTSRMVKRHDRERVSWHSSIDIHNSVVFAPTNVNLLSDADETWPDDLTTPVLKPSASVSRSITSLGKICEIDEKLFSNDETGSLSGEVTEQTELEIANHAIKIRDFQSSDKEATQAKEEIKLDAVPQLGTRPEDIETTSHVNTIEERKENIIADKTDSSLNKIEAEIEKVIIDKTASSLNKIEATIEKVLSDKKEQANVLPETERKPIIFDSSTSPIKIAINDNAFERNQVPEDIELTDKDLKNLAILESNTNVIFEAIQQKMKTSYEIYEPKHDYKVNTKTAPSWFRHDHGKGEPSEDSFQGGKSKEQLKDCEIRNWCKDLDRILLNMEMWNGWVDNTCKNILYLKQKREMNKLFTPNARRKDAKDWVILKKNIDKDAVLWTKLNQKAHDRLKTYKYKTKFQQPISSEKLNVNVDKETVLKSLQEIDRMGLWMHRTIVSTEYCMLCHCKNITKRNI